MARSPTARRCAATWAKPTSGWTGAAPAPNWRPWRSAAWHRTPPSGRATPARWPVPWRRTRRPYSSGCGRRSWSAPRPRRAPPRSASAAVPAWPALVGGGAAVGVWYMHDQAERAADQARKAAQVERDVLAALREAETFRHQGIVLAERPAEWGATLTSAAVALKRAETLLASE